jgi:nitroreductase
MLPQLSPDEVLTTTRAVRKRLDLERPVERSIVEECINIAVQAPSPKNWQTWQWVLVDDPDTRRGLADIYYQLFDETVAKVREGRLFAEDDPRARRGTYGASTFVISESEYHLRHHLHEVPVHLVPCVEGRPDTTGSLAQQASLWGSILPAAWNFCLAARARGLGTVWTTLHLQREKDAAELLGIPSGEYMQAGLIPVAYTLGTRFSPAPKQPLDSVLHWNHW